MRADYYFSQELTGLASGVLLAAQQLNPKTPLLLTDVVKEDVTTHSDVIKMTGLLSVSYRRINPATATLADILSLEERAHYEAEVVDGLEIGLFVQPSTTADLRSKSTIITELAETIATQVAEQLSAQFSDPVAAFKAEAEQWLAQNNEVEASLSLAKAYWYQHQHAKIDHAVAQQLVQLSLASEAFLEN